LKSNFIARYVVDASVAVKWYSKVEEDTRKADALLNKYIEGECALLAPSLICYELINALCFNPNLSEIDVIRASEEFSKLEIEFVDFANVQSEAISLAFEKGITIYDAVYVATSKVYSIPLITADLKLYDKIKDLAFVTFLANL